MNQFSNILFVADSAADNAAAFDHALTVANNNQAKLTVLGLVDAPVIPRPDAQLAAHKLLSTMVQQQREQLLALVYRAYSLATPQRTF